MIIRLDNKLSGTYSVPGDVPDIGLEDLKGPARLVWEDMLAGGRAPNGVKRETDYKVSSYPPLPPWASWFPSLS